LKDSQIINYNLGSYIKRKDIDGRHPVHIDFYFLWREEYGDWKHMCRFYLYGLIWSVYLYLMGLCCENVKI